VIGDAEKEEKLLRKAKGRKPKKPKQKTPTKLEVTSKWGGKDVSSKQGPRLRQSGGGEEKLGFFPKKKRATTPTSSATGGNRFRRDRGGRGEGEGGKGGGIR